MKSVLVLTLFLVTLVSSEDELGLGTRGVYHNPVLDYRTQDPYVVLHDDFYYMAQQFNNIGVTVYKSKSLTDWRQAEQRLVYSVPPGFSGLWAPEIHRIEDTWYIYYALDTGTNAAHRMYVIRALDSLDPLGDYAPQERISTPTEDFWAIDGTVLKYGNGELYFIWSGWPTIEAEFPQNLYIAPMSNPTTISGPRVLLREPKLDWEMNGAALLEGPQVLQHNGRTFVVFSASGSWTPDYCLGLMGIDELRDPLIPSNWWNDVDHPVFWRNDEQSVYGPGHASFTTSPDGTESWIVYHATQAIDGAWVNRTSRAEKFEWNSDGSPSFPRPSGFDVPLETPSGQEEAL